MSSKVNFDFNLLKIPEREYCGLKKHYCIVSEDQYKRLLKEIRNTSFSENKKF